MADVGGCTVGYFGVPYQINTFYTMFYGNIYVFGS